MRNTQSLLRRIRNHTKVPFKRTKGSAGGVSLDKLVTQIENEIRNVQLSLQTNLGHKSVPGCLVGSRRFLAQTDTVSITLPPSPDQQPQGTVLANYIIRDGNTYSIPVRNDASGAFCVKYISVYATQRVFVPGTGVCWTKIPSGRISGNEETVKTALFNYYFYLGGFNFFWNLEDSKSGRMLGDDLMSHLVLLPRSNFAKGANSNNGTIAGSTAANAVGQASASYAIPLDGDFFELEVPWIIERDGQVNLHFRPITPLLQFNSTIAGSRTTTGSDAGDDREMGLRKQDAIVYVELHGHKMQTSQDLQKAGALSILEDNG